MMQRNPNVHTTNAPPKGCFLYKDKLTIEKTLGCTTQYFHSTLSGPRMKSTFCPVAKYLGVGTKLVTGNSNITMNAPDVIIPKTTNMFYNVQQHGL